MNVRVLARPQIDPMAWDVCVRAAPNQITYGYSWYLDAVTNEPGWSWVGLVVEDAGAYRAVMPVPLRRKWGRWVVHQPLFCQFLGVFSREPITDVTPFFRAMQRQFRYGPILCLDQLPNTPSVRLQTKLCWTFTLDLSVEYETIFRHYSRDRVANLKRANRVEWQLLASTDPEPLLQLFRENHASTIPGGVAPWAYAVFRKLFTELHQRGLVTLRYASQQGQIQAGALFVRDENRIIYLFNAASAAGRRGNARTWLIDQIIRENAGNPALLFDFESPEKPAIAAFYASFGANPAPFWAMNYNRLTAVERHIQAGLRALARLNRASR